MKVLVLPKAVAVDAKGRILHDGIPTISILDSDVKEPIFDRGIEHCLTLFFDDITPKTIQIWAPASAPGRPLKYMDLSQAEEIIKFIMEWKTKDLFIMHCSAGICRSGAVASRSGAVASFMNTVLTTNPVKDLYDNNPYIYPNNWVENLLFYQLSKMGFSEI